MGRPEKSLDAHEGALQELAAGLRRLRASDGGRSYRQLAKAANFAASTLARAASGRTLPSWELTAAYVVACGGNPDDWRARWLDAARSLGRDAVRHLPADLRDFVGRAAESELLADVAAAIARVGGPARTQTPLTRGAPHIVVITGPGGIGKTSLAVHAAHRLSEQFADGQLFADLRGYDEHPDEPSMVASRLLASLGRSVSSGADPIAVLRSLTAGRRLLVLLDNASSERQVTPLVPASSDSLVIVTSRHALGGLASTRNLCLGAFAQDEAIELLSRVTGRERIARTADAVSLVELCGRFPLAVRIVAARLASSPPDKAGWLIERLRDEEGRLGQLTVGDLDLGAVFDVSYRGLPCPSRRVFRCAGQFPGPFLGAEAVAALADMTVPEVEHALEQLANSSLVEASGVDRYQMHDLVRLFAARCAEREESAAERSEAIRRLSAWYLGSVDGADRVIIPDRRRPEAISEVTGRPCADVADRSTAASWYDAQRANLVAVTRAAARHGHHDIAWRLAVAMRGLHDLRAHTEDWITVHRVGVDSARVLGDHEALGWVLNGLGIGYWRHGAYAESIDCYREALAVRTAASDLRGVAVVLNNLSNLYGAQGRHAEAVDCLREALAIHNVLGDDLDKSFALHNLGHVQHELGQHAEALPLLEEALRIRRTLGNRNSEAITLHCLGDTLSGLGRNVEALGCLRRALPIFREYGNSYGEAVTLHSIGAICGVLGRSEHAVRYLKRAMALYRDLDHRARPEMASATRELARANARALAQAVR